MSADDMRLDATVFDDDRHEAAFGFPLNQTRDGNWECACCGQPKGRCPRCDEPHRLALDDLHGACCNGCAERDAEGDVISSADDET